MDWQPLGTLVVGALGALGGAGWLVGRHTRRIARLKGEAELWKLLDDGDAKSRLREHLEASVLEYVKDQGAISPGWMMGLFLFWLASAVMLVIGSVIALVSSDHQPPAWWSPVMAAMVVGAVLCGARLSLHETGLVRRFRQAARQS